MLEIFGLNIDLSQMSNIQKRDFCIACADTYKIIVEKIEEYLMEDPKEEETSVETQF